MITSSLASFMDRNPVADELKNLRQFQYTIYYSDVPLIASENIRNAIAGILMSRLVSKLDALEIYAANNLTSLVDENSINITFSDDVYHFGVLMDKGKFVFVRRAGTISEFLALADILLDEITEIFHEISSYFEALKTQGGPSFNFTPHAVDYGFEFYLRDFKPSKKTNQESVANYELMERLVPSVQSKDSPFSSLGLAKRGRTDLKISGTLSIDDIHWIAWVQIEAPGNKAYSTMQLAFQLQSAVHDSGSGPRIPFNPNSIGKWRVATHEFLKERIFCGFLQDWLSDVNFESA